MNLLPNSYFLILTSILAAAIPTYLIRFSLGGIPTTLYEVLLWLVGIVALSRGWITCQFWKKDPLRWPIVLMILASLMALVISPDFRAALGQWKAIMVDSLLFYWLVREASRSWADFTIIETGAFMGGTVVALHAVLSALHGSATHDGRTVGLYTADPGASPNYLALYLTPLAVLLLLRFLDYFPVRPFIPTLKVGMMTIASGLMIAAIILSGSRGGLVALLVGVGVGIAWPLIRPVGPAWSRLVTTAAVGLGLLGGLMIIHQALPDFTLSPESGGRIVSSNNIRWEIWQTTGEILKRQNSNLPNPTWQVGLGWANYQTVFAELTKDRVNYPEFIAPLALHPHNFFLMTWVTLGLLGVIAWLGMIIIIFKRFRGIAPFQIALAAAVIAWLIQGIVDTTFYKNDLAPLWFLLAAGIFIENFKSQAPNHK